ncbi:MAG: helix-turn-helix domain-containing protein [Pirellulales bacterium]|nr:helix-turn-helix domain-containing protein [Pirellulales bacterium]
MESKTLLTESEAGDILRLPSRRILKLARQGAIPHIDLPGNEIRFERADLDKWIASHKREEATP